MLRVALALAVVAGCGGSTEDVTLSLSAGASCEPPALAPITVVSVEVYGDRNGDLCILNQRCVFNLDEPQTAEDLADALRAANPPLVDFEADGARAIGVIGHATSCWGANDRVACGFNDLAEASGGELPIQLACGTCDDAEIPFCP